MAKKRRMLKKQHFKFYVSSPNISGTMELNLSRFEEQFQRAQYFLDSQIMTDMVPYMPMQTGSFINLTRARSVAIAGSGRVVAAAPPYGRFLYKGKVMVDENTGSTWARKGAKKILVSKYTGKTNAKENLEFSKATNPKAQPEWFEAAKANLGREWIKDTKAIAGGG